MINSKLKIQEEVQKREMEQVCMMYIPIGQLFKLLKFL